MRVIKTFMVIVLSVVGLYRGSSAAETISYIPESDVEIFVFQKLDLSTFRSSLGPRRTVSMRTFPAFGMSPNVLKKGIIQFETDDWFYEIEIKGRKDYNGDGIEDLAICFTDRAKKGTYSARKSLLVTRYSKDGLLVALNYEIDACGK